MWAASAYGMKCVHFLAGAEAAFDSPPLTQVIQRLKDSRMLRSLNQIKIKDKYGGFVTVTDQALTGEISSINPRSRFLRRRWWHFIYRNKTSVRY